MSAFEDNHTESQLFKAVEQNDRFKLMELVLSSHCDPAEICNEQQETLLHTASRLGHLNMIRILVEVYGCSTSRRDSKNCSPSDCACLSGHLDTVLYYKAYDLHSASLSGSIPLMRLACAASQFGHSVANLKPILFSDSYYIICKHLGAAPFKNLLPFSTLIQTLSFICHTGNIKLARLTLDELANGIFVSSLNSLPDHQKISVSASLIEKACRLGHNTLANYLIVNKGLSVLCSEKSPPPEQDSHSNEVKKKRVRSSQHSDVEVSHSDVHDEVENHNMFQLSKTIAIHSVVYCGNLAAVRDLLLGGHYAHQSLINEEGDTLLHVACVCGRLDIVQFLVNNMQYDGWRSVDEWRSVDVAKYLFKKGMC